MRTLKTLIAILFIALPMLSYAAGKGGPRFEFAGTVDRIDTENDVIIIGDMPFRFSPGITILDTRQNVVNPNKLRTGQKVGVNTYVRGGQSDGIRYVHEMQILPGNADLEKIMDDD